MSQIPSAIPCPGCKTGELTFRSTEIEVPYFGKGVQMTLQCPSCGYKHNDFILTDLKEPTRFELKIESEEDLNIKVVRSASCTISVPELGLKVEPGIASNGYISNVEGVLKRFRDATAQAVRFSEGSDQEKEATARGAEIIDELDKVVSGKRSIHLILEDPFGNSAIISDRTRKRPISQEELKELKTGIQIADLVSK